MLRRRAQLHFQATFAYDVTMAALRGGPEEYPHLYPAVYPTNARDELWEDLRALGRNRWTLDTFRTMRH